MAKKQSKNLDMPTSRKKLNFGINVACVAVAAVSFKFIDFNDVSWIVYAPVMLFFLVCVRDATRFYDRIKEDRYSNKYGKK